MAQNSDYSIKVNVDFVGDDAIKKFGDNFKQMGDSVSSFGDSVNSIGKVWEENKGKITIASGAIFAGISSYIKGGISDINEYNYSVQRLETIMNNATGATKEETDSLIKHAEALEKVGVASKDNIVTGMSQFATFEMSTEAIDALTDAYVDYVVAEKGATASSEDYKSMANGLAQALQGNYASLTRSGFILDENTKSIIENGSEMERVEAIVEVLNSTYKDFNKTAAETAEGRLIMLKKNFGDIRENLAKNFMPVIEKVTEIIVNMTGAIVDFTEKHPKITTAIITIVGALTGLITVIGALSFIVGPLGTAFSLLTGPFGLIVAGIAAVIAIGVALYNHWDTIKEKAAELGNKFLEFYEKWKGLFVIFTPLIALGVELYQNWDLIKEKAGELKDYVVEVFQNIWDFVGPILGTIKDVTIETFNNIKDFLSPFTDWLKEAFLVSFENIKTVISTAWEIIKTIFSTALNFLNEIGKGFFALFTGDVKGFGEHLQNAFSGLWSGISKIFDLALGGLKDVISNSFNFIKDTIVGIFNTVKEFLIGWWDGTVEWFGAAKDVMIDAIVAPFEYAKEKVLGVYNWIKDKIDYISSWVGGDSSAVGGKANGGYVSAGTPYYVGEQGRELFIPNTAGHIVRNNDLGGNNISINITGNQIRSEAEAEILADLVINKLNYQMKISQFGI